jgi:hypothetical protein
LISAFFQGNPLSPEHVAATKSVEKELKYSPQEVFAKPIAQFVKLREQFAQAEESVSMQDLLEVVALAKVCFETLGENTAAVSVAAQSRRSYEELLQRWGKVLSITDWM